MILSSNRGFAERSDTDSVVATPLLDRLQHYTVVFQKQADLLSEHGSHESEHSARAEPAHPPVPLIAAASDLFYNL